MRKKCLHWQIHPINALLEAVVGIAGKTPKIEYKQLPPADPEKSSGTSAKMCDMFSLPLDDFTRLDRGLRETVEASHG